MKLINKAKEVLNVDTEAKKEKENIKLLDSTYKDNCNNVISKRKGPGNWRSTVMKLINFKKNLTDEKQKDYYFSFTGMNKSGFNDFEEYLTTHSHSKVWKKLLYSHNDIEEFQNDIKNIYRRYIYYYKFEALKEGKNLIANKDLFYQILFKIMKNKTSFCIDDKELNLEEYAIEGSFNKYQLSNMLESAGNIIRERLTS